MICMIPVFYPNVFEYAKKNGFNEVGTLKNARLKGGVLHDIVILECDKGVA